MRRERARARSLAHTHTFNKRKEWKTAPMEKREGEIGRCVIEGKRERERERKRAFVRARVCAYGMKKNVCAVSARIYGTRWLK